MARGPHYTGLHAAEPSTAVMLARAVLAVLLVTVAVASAVGGATYVLSRALVDLLS